jgi:hypothetical protein
MPAINRYEPVVGVVVPVVVPVVDEVVGVVVIEDRPVNGIVSPLSRFNDTAPPATDTELTTPELALFDASTPDTVLPINDDADPTCVCSVTLCIVVCN